MLHITPSSFNTCRGLVQRLSLRNTSETSYAATRLRSERRGAEHKFDPPHAFIPPLGNVTVTVTIDDTVQTDKKHKDRVHVVAVAATKEQATTSSVPDIMGNIHCDDDLFKAKVTIIHGSDDTRDPTEGSQLEGDDLAEPLDGLEPHECEELASLDPRTVVEHLVAPHSGRVIFSGFFGSAAYNLSLEGSAADVDVYGVYMAPLRDVLAARGPTTPQPFPEIISGQRRVVCEARRADIDFTVRELSNFASLLLAGSPNAVEMLFCDPDDCPPSSCYASAEWRALRDQRAQFVTRRFVLSYLGWGSAACETIRKKKDAKLRRKAACHAMRIAAHVTRVLDTGEGPVLRVPEGPQRDKILAVKRGECDGSISEVVEAVKAEIRELEERARDSRAFPDTVPEAGVTALNEWIYRVRIAQIV
eukprot:m51a1_g2577 hypothetical protein (418) ;mRNA; r:388339-389835